MPPTIDPRFGARMREIRDGLGLSLRALERRIPSSRSRLSAYETGKALPPLDVGRRIDAVLQANGELVTILSAAHRTTPADPVDSDHGVARWSCRTAGPHPDRQQGAIMARRTVVDPRFAARLRELRIARGMSLSELAKIAYLTKGFISNLERGAKLPGVETARALDKALGAEGELAALAQRRQADEADIGEEGDVYRRSVLTMLAGVPSMLAAEAMHLGPVPGVEVLRHNLTSLLGGPVADVAEWEETAWSYGCTYATTPPEELLSELRTDIALAGAQLASITSGPDRHSMQRVIALMAAFMAHTVANLGNSRAGLRWWRTARQFADASNDNDTRTWVRGREIVRGMYERRSLPALLAFADEAGAISQRPGMGTGSVLAGRAQVLAMLGRASEAREALAVVRDASERLPEAIARDEASMYGWPEHRLRYTESYVFTFLGDHARAEAAQDRAVALFPDHMFREHAQVELHRAIGLVRSGDIPGGVDHAQQVVGRLPAGHRIATILELARSVEAAVPPSERRRPQVAALREMLALPAGQAG